jgi:hypothetical protein
VFCIAFSTSIPVKKISLLFFFAASIYFSVILSFYKSF